MNGLEKKLGVCLIGCGNVSRSHLDAYMGILYANVVACCDINEEAAKKTASQYGIKKYYTDHKKALEDKDVDTVDICVSPQFHAEIAIDAMEAGKHVQCEKPMSLSLKDAGEMIKVSKRNKVNFMIGQSMRYTPVFAEAKKQIDRGKIGRPVIIRQARRYWNIDDAWGTPEGKKKYSGLFRGFYIIDTMIHHFDWIRWCLGEDPRTVYTEAETYPDESMPIFTQAHMTLDFKDVVGFIEMSRTTTRYPTYDKKIDVIGTKGRLTGFDLLNLGKKLGAHKEGPSPTPTPYTPLIETTPIPGEFDLEIADFLKSVIENKPVPIPPEDSRSALAMALAAKKSAETGEIVKLPLE